MLDCTSVVSALSKIELRFFLECRDSDKYAAQLLSCEPAIELETMNSASTFTCEKFAVFENSHWLASENHDVGCERIGWEVGYL